MVEAMKVSSIRISARKLLSRIKDAAKSSSNVVFIPPLEKRSIAGMMNFHVALKCLQDGTIVGSPKQNQNGHWELRMKRGAFGAKVIAECDGAKVSRLFVCFDDEEEQ